MTDHDPLCFLAQFPGKAAQAVGTDACTCAIIRVARADERAKVHVTSTGLSGRTDYAQVRSEVLADLRAKVEALRSPSDAPSTLLWQPRNEAIRDVLNLIDVARSDV